MGMRRVQNPIGMRVSALTALSCLAISASAYSAEPAALQFAFGNLRLKPCVFMQLVGTERVGFTNNNIQVDAYWDSTLAASTGTYRSKISAFKNGFETSREVGNGDSIFVLDVQRNEYGAASYGDVGTGVPLDNLLQSMVASSQSYNVFPARTLRDIFSSTGAVYKSWYPGITPIEDPDTVTYQDDPVTPRRQIIFHLDHDTHDLKTIDYNDSIQVGSSVKVVNWTLSFTTYDTLPSGWAFDFNPPAGSRAVQLRRGA